MEPWGDLDNLVTLPLSEFMFVVRALWFDGIYSNNYSETQDKIEILLNFLDLGREATIIDFAQYDLASKMQKLREQTIHVESGRQNGVMTFREKKAFNNSELTRLYKLHFLVQSFNHNNHIQMAVYEKEIAHLKAKNEQLQLIVRLHQVKQDESEDDESNEYNTAPTSPRNNDDDGLGYESDGDRDEMFEEDNKLMDNGYFGKSMNEQNPYCITIARLNT